MRSSISPLTRFARLCAVLLAGALLASCAGIIGPREVEISAAKLQAGIDRRFPLHNRALELFDVDLARPQLALLPDQDRIALTLEATVSPPFSRQSWHGTMALSGRLAIDMARSAIVMTEPHVDRFVLDGVDENRQHQFAKVANVLIDKFMHDAPVYNFRLDDLRYAGVQFVPTRIRTTPTALLITLEPAR